MSDQEVKDPKGGRKSCCTGHSWVRRFCCCTGHGNRFGKKSTKEDKLKALTDKENAIKEELAEIQKAKQKLQSDDN